MFVCVCVCRAPIPENFYKGHTYMDKISREPCVWNVNIVLFYCCWGWQMWLYSNTAHGLFCLWETYFNCSQTQMESWDLAATAAVANSHHQHHLHYYCSCCFAFNVGAHRLKSLTNAIYQEQLSSSDIWRICLSHASISVHNSSSQALDMWL